MKKALISFSLLFCVSLITAHEFWLEPERFMYAVGEKVNLRLKVGENFEGENWTGTNSSIQDLQLHLSDATDDLSGYIDSTAGDSLQFSIYDEGTYMVSFRSTNKKITLEPAKFLEYLKEDGLDNAIAYREAHQETDSMGREYYQRSVKTLIQVGEQTSSVFKKTTSLPLDIIPLDNPYDIKKGGGSREVRFKVLFQQQPLPNQLIKVWQRRLGETIMTEVRTDTNGLISIPVFPAGKWMISTVKMERIEGNPEARWQSYWGSCTFGYQ